jgi:hypothetical protein
MKYRTREKLMAFLKSELSIPADAIALADRRGEQDPNILSMVLWQYGLLTLEQLETVFNWLIMV